MKPTRADFPLAFLWRWHLSARRQRAARLAAEIRRLQIEQRQLTNS